MSVKDSSSRDPLSVYIHFPWCVKKCPYCDFNSHATGGQIPETAYIDALSKDIEETLAQFPGVESRPVRSIFFGGGTPSLMSVDCVQKVLNLIHQLPMAKDAEITLEANPGTTDQAHFTGYRAAGVNRISLGVQSFSNEQLKQLGRIHDSSQAKDAVLALKQAGFENFNIDLMHGLPGQTIEKARQDLQQAIELEPTHISWYQLTIEPNTEFNKYPPILPEEDTLWDIYEAGMETLKQAGFERYEVSAFARAGKASQHNMNYWQFGDYLGFGAGAHGKVTTPEGIFRTSMTRLPKDYLNYPRRQTRRISDDELLLQFLMNSLRLTKGFERGLFQARTGLPDNELDRFVTKAVAKQLLAVQGSRLAPTLLGTQFLNDLLLLVD